MDTPRENPATLDNDDVDDTVIGSARLEDGVPMPPDSRRVSDETNVHDAGSGANDTQDGLDEMEESVRHAAEDIPTGQDPVGPTESVPVFDRGGLPPKI